MICCNKKSYWVENVVGKGYYFCDMCRKEVLSKSEITSAPDFKFPEEGYLHFDIDEGYIYLDLSEKINDILKE